MKMKKKILFMVLDGLCDRKIKELGDKTPLEAAKTPNFDWLAKNGTCGLLEPVWAGKFPTSKDTHLALFGYNPKKWTMGRGAFEVLGIGMKLKKGDVALRGDFATVADDMTIIDRRAGRIKDSSPFVKKIQGIVIDKVKFIIKKGTGHRVGVIMRASGLSENISDNDLYIEGKKPQTVKPLDRSKEAKRTAKVLNEFLRKTHLILKDCSLNKRRLQQGKLPVNYLLLRTAGKFKELPEFERKWKLKPCCVAGAGLYKGIGKVLKMELIKVKGATGESNTNLSGKIRAAIKSFSKHDFCFLHIKATDDFSHDGDFIGKKNFLEEVDKKIKPFLSLKNVLIIITADHCTPCKLKKHSNDPVPVLVYGPRIKKDNVHSFSEKACKNGGFGKIQSINFLKMVLKIIN